MSPRETAQNPQIVKFTGSNMGCKSTWHPRCAPTMNRWRQDWARSKLPAGDAEETPLEGNSGKGG